MNLFWKLAQEFWSMILSLTLLLWCVVHHAEKDKEQMVQNNQNKANDAKPGLVWALLLRTVEHVGSWQWSAGWVQPDGSHRLGALGPWVAAPPQKTSFRGPQSYSERGRSLTLHRSGWLSGQTTHSGSGRWAGKKEPIEWIRKKKKKKTQPKAHTASTITTIFKTIWESFSLINQPFYAS